MISTLLFFLGQALDSLGFDIPYIANMYIVGIGLTMLSILTIITSGDKRNRYILSLLLIGIFLILTTFLYYRYFYLGNLPVENFKDF